MIGGNLHEDNPDAVGVLDPHLNQSGAQYEHPTDRYPGRRQSGMLLQDIPHLDSDHQRAPRRAECVSADPEQSLAEEENHPGAVRRAELPVDGQAQDVAVEAEASVRVAGEDEDPAAYNVHVTTLGHTGEQAGRAQSRRSVR